MAPSPSLKSSLTQLFPPKPSFTGKAVPDLTGKVYIVTGANTGTGKELTRLLYTNNAKVYLLARSEEKTSAAVADIQQAVPNSGGSLHFIKLDLADLSTIKQTVQNFLALEAKLHVLFNNAGVLSGAKEVAVTAQGYELHTGVNVLGTFLLSQLLTPILVETAKSEPPSTVRVVWTASSAAEVFAEEKIGVRPETLSLEAQGARYGFQRYWFSKVANWAHAAEYARRHQADGVVSVPLNPGNLQSDLYRDLGWFFKILEKLMMYPPVNGAYTELFAGLSPEVNIDNTGCWVIPFGRVYPIREDMVLATRTEAEGGTGGNLRLWEWSEAQVAPYL
ncbi:short-chain alcohol dehydrogenase [Cytospora paraplurivora]|uniref:Short-chain alcohol dehydrogenase n=1 Tax=Cytospora paraplurivora TaxID=2898453 RepID=A0AAN9YF66_9PEZI